ncbi:glycerophosphodiester phosphodiesterase [Planococcus lenghuensis]|uniref:GP-PDE domain-containing protein n=1 Tax=Planococcus lenghuensis TaxID=2213202 RepID=A0A1Q2L4T1_9BACL|nr:glycerophosphodiester phosphodiesterase family protein [Planococcus lenghuensis]AQQ55465.1 hypothetical protein B0X71_20130 [Planococcus lenghuensis]
MEKVIAHRGWSGKAPENTLSAIKLALEEPKIDSIEIDVHLTKDGVPVVIHDHTVDRTTNGTGYIKDLRIDELKALDAGSWFSPSFAQETIPTLEEVLKLINRKKKLFIELKQTAGLYKGLEEQVIHLIKKYGAEDHCYLISFDHKSLQMCMKLHPNIKRTLVLLGSPLLLVNQVNEIKASAVSRHYQYVDQELIESLNNNGTEILVWTVDQKTETERLFTLDNRIIFTSNHPNLLWV